MGPEEIRKHLDDMLPRVEKPSRYFAGELGKQKKAWEETKVRVVIAFPDVYDLAVANLGHLLIREILNSRDEILAERVYTPWPDMQREMRRHGTPLYSLESFRPVRDFDILGVSLSHELAYSNVLLLLDLAGLPLRSEERGFPIVVAGGPAAFNPEPLAEFIDVFVLGDGEEVALRLAGDVGKLRSEIDSARGNLELEKALKKEITDSWGGAGGKEPVQGVYVPSHFQVEHDSTGVVRSICNVVGGPSRIEKAVVSDLESSPWLSEPPFPHIQSISGRVTVEPVRGCTHGCRFCQAGMIYRPWRSRTVDLLIRQAEKLLDYTGHQELSFLALSLTDWSHLDDFLTRIQLPERDIHLKVSLPSGRISSLTRRLTDLLWPYRKGGLTLAVEAATDRLRKVINKDVTDEDIDRAVENAVLSGWDLIKLYFMIGLPEERDEDVAAIVDLVKRIRGICTRVRKGSGSGAGRMRITVSVSNFVPKPHTPFQWAAMEKCGELDRKQRMLLPLRSMKGVECNCHYIDQSWLEGILARGDRRLGPVIMNASLAGALFDAWENLHRQAPWFRAFIDSGLDPYWYLRERDLDEILPWDHLSCGVSKEWLKSEWRRAKEGRGTPDCREAGCQRCGVQELVADCGRYG